MKRRHFLQATTTALSTIGLSQLNLQLAHQALAQPRSRKLALLVGINQYSGSIDPLKGCLTDVQLQYELLRHRYGFNPADILTLTDTTTPPTRNNILTAFEEHLIKQAKPGDTVVFHYSGHGALMSDPEPIDGSSGLNGTLIPMDATSTNYNDIMGKTLFLLSSQVNTDNFTMVLDSCHSGGGTRGNNTVRALRRNLSDTEIKPSAEELNYQEQQMRKLDLSREKLLELRTKGIAKGIAIGSTQANQLATDAEFTDFSAGALTYLLTRYLWQLSSTEDITTTFDRLALITQELASGYSNTQQPIKDTAPNSPLKNAPIYNLISSRPSAEGVVRSINPNGTIEFWLGGVAEGSLRGFAMGSLFTMIDEQGKPIGELEQIKRSGLTAYGKLKSGQLPKPGTLLREKLRNLPTDITLTIGLHESLGADRTDCAKLLNAIPQFKTVPLNQGQSVNFILGRLTDEARKSGSAITNPSGTIGLFTANYDVIDRDLLGRAGEPIERAIDRLRPNLKMFLAREYLARMINGNASQLNIKIELKSQDHTQILSKGSTRSTSRPKPYKLSPEPGKFTPVDVILTNQESEALYTSLIQINSDGIMTILHPADWNSPEAAAAIAPLMTQTIKLEFIPPAGKFELLIIASASPLRESLKGLQTIARSRGITSRSAYLSFDRNSRSETESDNSVVTVARSLVKDITFSNGPIARGLDTSRSAIYSTTIQTID